MGFLAHPSVQHATDGSGSPVAEARRYVFHNGTQMLAPLFSDPDLTTTTANPMISDANGDFGLCYLMAGEYTVEIKDQFGVVLATHANIRVTETPFPIVFASTADLLADDLLSYTEQDDHILAAEGQVLTLQNGHGSFEVAPATSTDADFTTAGGVHLYARADTSGFVTPEQFGTVGDGVSDDTDALLAMTQFGRRTGFLNWRGTAGKIYTTTRSRIFASIPYQKHFYNGAAIRNIRGSSSVEVGQTSNYTGIEFPSVFDTQQEADFTGGYYYGETIATVASGQTDITVTGATSNVGLEPGADVLIYGFSSTGVGFPPDPRVFEYARIKSVSGSVVTLENPIQNSYNENWPERSGGDYGAPRIISYQRPNFVGVRSLEVHDMWIKSNPNWTTPVATANDGERNGRLTLSGYLQATFHNLRTDGGFYISQGQNFVGHGVNNRTSCEPDKIIDRVEINNLKTGQIHGGTIIKDLILNDPQCGGYFNLAPCGRLEVNGGKITADEITAHMLDIPSGVGEISLNNVEFAARSASQRGIVAGRQSTATFTVVSPTQLSIATDTFYSSAVSRSCSENMVLYKDGFPAFRLSQMPYESGGVLVLDGQSLVDLTGTETLSVFTLQNLTVKDPKITGPYAPLIRAWNNPNYQSSQEVARVDSPWEGDTFVEFNDGFFTETDPYIFPHFGRWMLVERIFVNVSQPYTGAAANARLRFRNYSNASASYCDIDLTRAGHRIIDLNGGHFLFASDVGSLAGNSTPLGIGRVDRTILAGDTAEDHAKWTLRVEGKRLF
ncbi:hypothetical protein J7443_20065 [Tropicibacter sp. R15_0]|uniref:hypothetical protein n=1 Tax=Tropicibacter sp. R15_0 TaxID=2821101 RepID=UPI001ADB525B|nr:hypothetical protein [Tropicibacter sp. R15_0]MBO9467539.1 hypothetical protein [Tropicibacter sp. R15_0]